MKTYLIDIDFNKDDSPNTIDRLFKFYLWLSHSWINTGYRQESHEVYDHLGIIDTLGCQTSNSRFTDSYADELTCLFTLHFWRLIRINLYC